MIAESDDGERVVCVDTRVRRDVNRLMYWMKVSVVEIGGEEEGASMNNGKKDVRG